MLDGALDLPVHRASRPGFIYEQSSCPLSLGMAPELSLAANASLADLCDPTRPAKPILWPYSQSIEAGKNSYVYDAHTYHTKVPPQGIIPLVEYYTEPGAVVLDPFCGSGMTGVAAMEAGRAAVLCDAVPAAAFIAYNHVTPAPAAKFMEAVRILLAEGAPLERYLYDTNVRGSGARVPMLYTVWSYGMLCSVCGKEFVLWDVARDERESVKESKILSEFDCPHCFSRLSKRHLKRTKRYPVQVGYTNPGGGTKEATAAPDADDLDRLAEIERGRPASGPALSDRRLPRRRQHQAADCGGHRPGGPVLHDARLVGLRALVAPCLRVAGPCHAAQTALCPDIALQARDDLLGIPLLGRQWEHCQLQRPRRDERAERIPSLRAEGQDHRPLLRQCSA